MTTIDEIEHRLSKIESRNQNVTLDKKREWSVERKIAIIIITYLIIGLYLWFIWLDKRYIHAIVPTLGFILSTLSLAFIKNIWIRKFIIK